MIGYEKYIGPNYSYYVDRFHDFDKGGQKETFNIAAFLFTGLWTLYRKMYGWFFFFVVFYAVFGFIDKAVEEKNKLILYSIGLSVQIIFAVYANYLLYRKIKKEKDLSN